MTVFIDDAMKLIGPGCVCEVNLGNILLLTGALREAIEQHETFKQEVSYAVEHCRRCSDPEAWRRIKFELARFIIAKPDPLVEAMAEWQHDPVRDDDYSRLRAALAKRGLEIREKGE